VIMHFNRLHEAISLPSVPMCNLAAVFLLPHGLLFGGMESAPRVQVAFGGESLLRLLWHSLLAVGSFD